MFKEAVDKKMLRMGVTQTELCKSIGYCVQNFNAFIVGRRVIPVDVLVKAMKELKLTIDDSSKEVSNADVSGYKLACKSRMKELGLKVCDVSNMSGMNESTIYSFLNGRHSCSVTTLERILDVLDITVMDYKEVAV